MASRYPIALDGGCCAALRTQWARALKDVDRAAQACRRSLSEPRVHALRLACRHALPVLELMRELRPDDPIWNLAHRMVKGIGTALGPLRDAQVRRIALQKMRSNNGSVPLERAREEERFAGPRASAALDLLGVMPRTALKGALRLRSPKDLDELRDAIESVQAHAQQRVRQAKSIARLDDMESLHAVRIALKRYRYLLIAIAPCLSTERRAKLETLRHLQTTIGDRRDEEDLIRWLEQGGPKGRKLAHARRAHRTAQRRTVRAMLQSDWEF